MFDDIDLDLDVHINECIYYVFFNIYVNISPMCIRLISISTTSFRTVKIIAAIVTYRFIRQHLQQIWLIKIYISEMRTHFLRKT